jgi:hypothetical protein
MNRVGNTFLLVRGKIACKTLIWVKNKGKIMFSAKQLLKVLSAVVVLAGVSGAAYAEDPVLTCRHVPLPPVVLAGQQANPDNVQPQLLAIPRGSANWYDYSAYGGGLHGIRYSYKAPYLGALIRGGVYGSETQRITLRIVRANLYDTLIYSTVLSKPSILHSSQYDDWSSVAIGATFSGTGETMIKGDTNWTLIVSESSEGNGVVGSPNNYAFDRYSYVCRLPITLGTLL